MLITSKFQSICTGCHSPIRIGDQVSWSRGDNVAMHALCSPEGKILKATIEKSRAVDAPDLIIPCPEGLAYLPYQKAGIAYAMEKRGILIADEMGLGKTIQAIGVINGSPDIQRVCIVCPDSLKQNWYNELGRWLARPLTFRIVNGVVPTSNILIINYDSLKRIPEHRFDLLILDEAHYCKNPKSIRSMHAKMLAKQSKRIIALTGTPLPNRPLELWPLLQMLQPEVWDRAGRIKGQLVDEGEGAGFLKFVNRYCDPKEVVIGQYRDAGGGFHLKTKWSFAGASNLPELQEKLRGSCMVRRLKKDVLKELPPKRRQIIVLPASSSKDGELYDVQEMPDNLDECIKILTAGGKVAFEKFSAMRHEQGLRKVPLVLEHVKNALDSSQKVILFGHHKDILETLRSGLSDWNPAFVTGDVEPEDRMPEVERFQKDESCRVFIGSVRAAGVGLTLTASSHVMFAEGSYVPGEMTQAEDRAHRIGQKNFVLVQHIVQAGTLDAHMMRLVVQKQEIIDLALDSATM